MDTFGAFDFAEIRHDCWQQCEADPNGYNDDDAGKTSLPLYRDPATASQFQAVGKFFNCVDVCEDGFNGKRIAFIVPMVLIGIFIIGTLICCCFCKRSCFHRIRKDRQKGSALVSEDTSTLSSSASFHKPKPDNVAAVVRKNWGGLYTVSAKLSSKVGDIHQRTDSSASANSSWITDEDDGNDHCKTGRKNATKDEASENRSKMLRTQKLGKRLIEMDKKAEEIEAVRKSKKGRQGSLTQVETTDIKTDD